MANLTRRDPLWILPLSVALGAGFTLLQGANWLTGFIAFSFLAAICILILTMATRWAGGGAILAWIVAIAFALRLALGIGAYVFLPIDGHDDEVNRAGFIYKDAYQRDQQAWALATSSEPIRDAFSQSYAFDQYGGLLAFCALIYRYLSPDLHRPLLLMMITAFTAALGIPFLWKASSILWGQKLAVVSGWLFALYPESILLGNAAMREPYLMTFSAMALWGFASWLNSRNATEPGKHHWLPLVWLGIALAGMLLVSPAIALMTLVLLAGWLYFTGHENIPWWAWVTVVVLFVIGLMLLSSALDPRGEFSAATPLGVVNNWLRSAIRWDFNQLVDESGWVQKLFDAMPEWMRMPFVMGYGVLQPVLPAAIVAPTTTTWKVITILRAVGWYVLLPLLVFSMVGLTGLESKERKIWLWIGAVIWFWILLAAVRGGGDQWDNPRYRSILFLWQALLAARAVLLWREKRPFSFWQVIAGELVFLVVFTQWYASRYYSFGGRLEFGPMVALILGLWALIACAGLLINKVRRPSLRTNVK